VTDVRMPHRNTSSWARRAPVLALAALEGNRVERGLNDSAAALRGCRRLLLRSRGGERIQARALSGRVRVARVWCGARVRPAQSETGYSAPATARTWFRTGGWHGTL
jgi:hypothetical protein